jgi:hypothetical protein
VICSWSLTPKTNNDKPAFGRFLFAPLTNLHPRHPIFAPKPHEIIFQGAPPLSWGMWAQAKVLNSPQKQGRTAAAPPLSKVMWAVYCCSKRIGAVRNTRGDPWSASQNMSHDKRCGSFPLIPHSFPSHWPHIAQRQHIEWRNEWWLPRTRRYEPNEGVGSCAMRWAIPPEGCKGTLSSPILGTLSHWSCLLSFYCSIILHAPSFFTTLYVVHISIPRLTVTLTPYSGHVLISILVISTHLSFQPPS